MVTWSESDLHAHENKARRLPSGAKPQSAFCDAPDAEAQGKAGDTVRHKISYISYRRRLLDPENVCTKYFTDALRYEKLIEGDTLADVEISARQVKVKTKSEEFTTIEIECWPTGEKG